MKRLLLVLLLPVLGACSGSDAVPGHDDAEPPVQSPPPQDPPPVGNVTGSATIPNNMAPPVGVTWHVGITENVTLAQMQVLFASFVAGAMGWPWVRPAKSEQPTCHVPFA